MEKLEGLTELATEYWRVLRSYKRAVVDLPIEKHARVNAQIRYAENRLTEILNENGLRLLSYEGQPYTINLPVTVVNSDDFQDEKELVIEQTLEPTVIAEGRVLSMGKVILKKES